MGRIYSTSRHRRKRSESNYQILPSIIGHDPYGADKNALALIDLEIAQLEIEQAQQCPHFHLTRAIEEVLMKDFEKYSEYLDFSKEPLINWKFLTHGLLEFLFQVLCFKDVFYHKRQEEISSRKNILMKLRDSLRSKISRAFVVPNIRSKLQKILKPLFRRCVGEEPIKFFTYDSKLINLIEHKNDRENTIYRNYRLAS